MKKTLIVLAAVAAGAALGGCAPGSHNSTTEQSTLNTAGLEAFKTGFYAFTQTQKCSNCHSSAVNPYFAAADVSTAYAAAKGLVDFSNPSASIFATYAGNNHCGASPCNGSSNESTVKSLLTAWAEAELDVGGPPPPSGPKHLTTAVAIPTGLSTLGTAKVVRFELSALSPQFAALAGAVLEVEVQLANPTTYRFNRVKIAGNTSAVTVSGLHLYVKPGGSSGDGVEEDSLEAELWHALSATAPVFARPATLPAGPLAATPLVTTAIYVPVQVKDSDQLVIGIENLK